MPEPYVLRPAVSTEVHVPLARNAAFVRTVTRAVFVNTLPMDTTVLAPILDAPTTDIVNSPRDIVFVLAGGMVHTVRYLLLLVMFVLMVCV